MKHFCLNYQDNNYWDSIGEVAALRGAGWGKKHATVDYVFAHSPYKLYQYHLLVMAEMQRRGYRPAAAWLEPTYRGKRQLLIRC